MIAKPLSPATNEAAIFEAGYMAGTLRARREFTWAQRAAIVAILTSAAPDPRVAAEAPEPRLRSFALIMARCESAASLLSWRKQIVPSQKRRLDAAIHRLQEAAAQVAVRAAVRPSSAKRDIRVPLFRVPGR